MGTTKSKILAIFLMSLFFQRVGPALFLKTYISEYIYKEQCISISEASKGKVSAQNLMCCNNRVYQECNNTILTPAIILPLKTIKYIDIHFSTQSPFVSIGTILKQSALRGPPVC